MSVRHKLVWLQATFAVFAVAVAAATIFAVEFHVRNAMRSLDGFVDRSNLVDHLRVEAQRQVVQLREIVEGRREVDDAFRSSRTAFFAQLNEAGSYARLPEGSFNWSQVLELGKAFRASSDHFLDLVQASRNHEARTILDTEIEARILGVLEVRLNGSKRFLDASRRASVDRVLATNAQLLWLSVLIAVACAGFLTIGVSLVRRWLIAPITELRKATTELGKGRLAYRVHLDSDDEFGVLGVALNDMASSLEASRTKYQSLFENLRDAVIICDAMGVVIECRDSDTELLGITPEELVGQRLDKIWKGGATSLDWSRIVSNVLRDGAEFRAGDVDLLGWSDRKRIADIVAYPIEYGHVRHVAVVARDVTERHRLQRLARRAETIEATTTFARGIAHDFKNLLNSAVTTLSLMASEASDDKIAGRLRSANQACVQAANLARKLLSFAATEMEVVQTISLSETVELILESMDETFLGALDVSTELDPPVLVLMDKDQLTQIVLNLIHNAHEAMPGGGLLRIAARQETAIDPLGPGTPAPYAVLTVADTGLGMTADVKERLFEPLFSTKPRETRGLRGLGLAVVYSAVKNAGGFIQVESEVGAGATFQVFLPVAPESLPGASTNAARRAERSGIVASRSQSPRG